MARLKAETRVAHEAIEATIDINNASLSLKDYSGLLARFYGYYQPVEEKLSDWSGWADWGLDRSERLKTPFLEADLTVLECVPLAALPRCQELPPLDAPADYFGCLYVLEGATLGGQFISRHILNAFGITADRGGRFFRCYGERTGEMWRRFGTSLMTFATSSAQEEQVIAAAIATFQTLTHWFATREVS
jgi:heme oxygenase